MTQYLDKTNAMPEYMPYPKFLLKMDLTPTAKLIYVMLLDRYTLSKKNGWKDSDGHIYLVYTIENLAADGGMGLTAIKRGLNELTAAGLIRRTRHGFSSPSRIYLLIPEETTMVSRRESGTAQQIAGCENNRKDWLGMYRSAAIQPETVSVTNDAIQSQSDSMTDAAIQPESTPVSDDDPDIIRSETIPVSDEIPASHQPETVPVTDTNHTVREPSAEPSYSPSADSHAVPAPSPNHGISNPVSLNQSTQTSERAYGEFGNVMLTEAEYDDMRRAYPDIFPAMLDFLSARIRDNQIPDEPHPVILRRMLE